MKLTSAQLKGRIKKLAQTHHADARILLRIYMMERFLERISVSTYKDNFIIKGGILVTSLIGVALRSTMDIDTTIKNLNLSEKDMRQTIEEICAIDLQDDVVFQVKQLTHIMDEMEYPGIRIALNAFLGKMPVPLKLDISTGDIITPKEITYQYTLLLEDRTIPLWSYNLETLLAEKLQTVLYRNVLNTRMRDFYDLYELTKVYQKTLNPSVLTKAFQATCSKRNSQTLLATGFKTLAAIQQNQHLMNLWASYQTKYTYATDIPYENIMQSIFNLWEIITKNSTNSSKKE